MKIFALKEESSDNSETVVYGWLTYFEEEKEFRIRLCEEIDYWECPIFFSPFVKKGEYVLNVHWSRAWVQQRILPWERQNLQMILQKNQTATKLTAPQRALPECSAIISRRSFPSRRAMPGCLP